MTLILGIETSCDETGASVYDVSAKKILSSALFSQVKLHEAYGGVVPEIASRCQLEKISPILELALKKAEVDIGKIDVFSVANRPGLVGSLLVGVCFAKGLAWSLGKKIIGVDHLEAHIASTFLKDDYTIRDDVSFPFITLLASGGHTALYLVKDLGDFEMIGSTLDDAAGEAFDKTAKVLGLGYPGGRVIEQLAQESDFQDFISYPRTKSKIDNIFFSFSGLKTAVLYDLVKKGAYDLAHGAIQENLTEDLVKQVASSLLVCIGDIFVHNVRLALKKHSNANGVSFVGGVACNRYLRARLQNLASEFNKDFFCPIPSFCTDNGAMVALVGGYKAQRGEYDDFYLDVKKP